MELAFHELASNSEEALKCVLCDQELEDERGALDLGHVWSVHKVSLKRYIDLATPQQPPPAAAAAAPEYRTARPAPASHCRTQTVTGPARVQLTKLSEKIKELRDKLTHMSDELS